MFIEEENQSNLLYAKNIHIVNLFLYVFTATIAIAGILQLIEMSSIIGRTTKFTNTDNCFQLMKINGNI